MFLETDKVGLRQLEREDLAQARDWRNAPEIRSRTREYIPLNMLNQEQWFQSLTDRRNIMFAIIRKDSSKFIGVCGLVHIDWRNRSGELSSYIGDKENRGQGFARHFHYLLFDYGFRELGLHRIWSEVYGLAGEIIEIDKKLGLTHEGIQRDAFFNDGKYWDSYIFSILDREWGKLRADYMKRS